MKLPEIIDDKVIIPVERPFRIGSYLKEGGRIFIKRPFAFLMLSTMIGAINVLSVILSWYYAFIFSIILLPICYAAMYGVANRIRINDYPDSDDYFLGIENLSSLSLARFVQSSLQYLLIIPVILFYKPFVYILQTMFSMNIKDELLYLPAILFSLLLIYVVVSYIFTDQYIVFKQQNYWEAMTSSRKRVQKQWFYVFFLLLLLVFIAIFIFILFYGLYFYWILRENGYEGEMIDFIKNIDAFSFDFRGLYNGALFVIAYTFPYTYCVLHAAFADIEYLPKEAVIIKTADY